MQGIEIIVHGRVQGVYFRYFIQEQATKLGLKGWVKNEDSDKVHIMAEGSEESIRNIIQSARKGPPLAHVIDVDITYFKPQRNFSNFTIKY